MKISHTDRLGVWVFIDRDDALRPWANRVLVGLMWAPRRRRAQ